MDHYSNLMQLEYIPTILNYQCDESTDIKNLYKIIPHILVPVLLNELKSDNSCFSQVIRLCLNQDTEAINICQGYDELEMNCDITENRFIIYYVDLTFLKHDQVKGRHSEVVLVDTLYETVEFFEPNGPAASWYNLVNSYFEYYFSELLPNYRYLATSEFCPNFGPQAKSELPVCGAFSLLFLMLRIKNEDLTSGEVISQLVNLSKSELKHLLYQFICYIDNYARSHKLLSLQNIYDYIVDQLEYDRENRKIFDDLYLKLDRQGLIDTMQLYGIDFP